MRGILLVAAIGACAVLSSCDQGPQTAQTTAPAAPTCACRPTPPEEASAPTSTSMPMLMHTAHHRRHHWRSEQPTDMTWNEHRRWRGDYSRTDFSESVLAPYNYVSSSSVSYSESDASYEDRANYANGDYDTRMRRYGRRPHETIAATMTGERLDPWHGYDVDCPR